MGISVLRSTYRGPGLLLRLTIMLLLLSLLLRALVEGIEYGQNGYIEYHKGEVGLVIAAPHGGFMDPDTIPDRSWGTVEPDSFTRDLALVVAEEVTKQLGGRKPHLVISNLKRKKLDPNREVVEAAQGNPEAMQAWLDYHTFIDKATAVHEVGVVIDLHGQSHRKNSTEMGYLLSTESLNKGDFDLDRSSMMSLSKQLDLSGEEVMAGNNSLGSFLEVEGYKAFPSPRQPSPGDWAYFPGGYTVVRHSKGTFDSISVETPREVRIDAGRPTRVKFGEALGRALANYYRTNYKQAYRRIVRGLTGYQSGLVPQQYL